MSEKLKIIEKLRVSTPDEKLEMLHEMMDYDLDDEVLYELTGLLSSEDRNIR